MVRGALPVHDDAVLMHGGMMVRAVLPKQPR